jgi:hypothetical protein
MVFTLEIFKGFKKAQLLKRRMISLRFVINSKHILMRKYEGHVVTGSAL